MSKVELSPENRTALVENGLFQSVTDAYRLNVELDEFARDMKGKLSKQMGRLNELGVIPESCLPDNYAPYPGFLNLKSVSNDSAHICLGLDGSIIAFQKRKREPFIGGPIFTYIDFASMDKVSDSEYIRLLPQVLAELKSLFESQRVE